ncbi:hypothetical protein BH20ACT17_BH20ACT17_06130 [soil metagenome]
MRSRGLIGRVVLLVAAATTALAPAAPASAGGTPGPARSGGTAFGSPVPKPAKRPVAARLTLTPRRVIAAGTLPQISFRVGQHGVRKVKARVTVLRLPYNKKLTAIALGWVRTGRTVRVRWPRGIALRAGRYLVRLHASDPRGHTLRRSAKWPGRAVIVVRRPPRPVPAPGISPGRPGVFPVAGAFDFGGPDRRFGAGRAGHLHEGQDITAASGTPVLAPYAGTISATSYQHSGAGEYVVLDAADGRDYFFAHCVRGSTAVGERQAVARGQRLCAVGATGTASGPHLHFEIWNVGWRIPGGYPIDPLPELRAWAGR